MSAPFSKLFSFFFGLYLFVGCSLHSEYLISGLEFSDSFAWKSDTSALAFLAINSLYRPPQGIATFPDGGTPEYVYYDVALYYASLNDKAPHRAVDLNELSRLHRKIQLEFINLAFTDSLLYYTIGKPFESDIEAAKKRAQTRNDSLRLDSLIIRTSKTYVYNINSRRISEIASDTAAKIFHQQQEDDSLRKIGKNYIKNLSLSAWGIHLKKIYPQSDQTYQEYIIYMKGDHRVREEILEQIISHYKKDEIRRMIDEMGKYKKKIDREGT
ncbi:MAG TPA: hypothetical protein EYP36_08945, partial [Calditrichaeota bacterium]|nr:hypothetical protein [Calditrichota bacterium]